MQTLSSGNPQSIDISVLRRALENKDAWTIELLDGYARKLAFGINKACNLLNPEMVVIGGAKYLIDTVLSTRKPLNFS